MPDTDWSNVKSFDGLIHSKEGKLIDTKVGMSSKDDLIQWLEKYI